MLFFLFFILAFLLLFPDTVCSGAKDGLFLWATVVLPSLFPFCLCTSLIRTYTNGSFSKYLLLFAGILSGYPIGAKLSGELYQKGVLFRLYQQCQSDVCHLFCRRLSSSPRKRTLSLLSSAPALVLSGKFLHPASPLPEFQRPSYSAGKCSKKGVR